MNIEPQQLTTGSYQPPMMGVFGRWHGAKTNPIYHVAARPPYHAASALSIGTRACLLSFVKQAAALTPGRSLAGADFI